MKTSDLVISRGGFGKLVFATLFLLFLLNVYAEATDVLRVASSGTPCMASGIKKDGQLLKLILTCGAEEVYSDDPDIMMAYINGHVTNVVCDVHRSGEASSCKPSSDRSGSKD